MAKMYPVITHNNHHIPLSEQKVYKALSSFLSDEWNVYCNVRLQKFSNNKIQHIESDFICSHREYGMILLEVKGGINIRFVPEEAQWYSTNLNMDVHPIKNGYSQARSNYFSVLNILFEKVNKKYSVSNFENSVNIAYGVVFSDVGILSSGNLPIEADKELTLFDYHLNESLEKQLKKTLQHFNSEQGKLNYVLHDELHALLAPTCELKKSLKSWINDEQSQIFELTDQQYQLLNFLQMIPKASIYGCAGSGKTLLAIEKAKLEALKGHQVMLVCFNIQLGILFRESLSNIENIKSDCFHNIVSEELSIDSLEYLYNDEYLLETSLDYLPKYDCIVVDEAQDFNSYRIEVLHEMLKENGSIYYFWDDKQAINFNEFSIPNNLPLFTLTTNFRNTEKIFNTIKKHITGDLAIQHQGPLGRNIEVTETYQPNNTSEMHKILKSVISKLINSEGLSPSDISVLTLKGQSKTSLYDLNFKFEISKFENTYLDNKLRIETIRRFKGLESKVVILTEMDDYVNDSSEQFHDLCYVAISRAIHHCIIIPAEGLELLI